ncbi:N-acyltransferase YncA [Tsuneonella dongtanensis]|uniref:N-acyltransferase YncA n=1 Tax=Tsuneonella dongtanensis TaxID=692370 RepID=A0A1B2AF80_9SPHN|nr:GNAT family N-acetyltransferase [Tsuneonella dongtanensis]ANY20803.1 N-acyltransferase YncA [Tsuneonella dongtanensis]
MTTTAIRTATPDDAEAVAAIYAHHVLHGTASFDTEPPPVHFWTEKIGAIVSRGWPFLVAMSEGAVTGYAYASQFRDRPAYAHTCEDSIYIAPDRVGQGVGTSLLAALIDAAHHCGFEQMIAVIGGAEPASVALHMKAGFEEAGRMRGVGRKFGRTLDTLYMQRALG